jgi:hypothetical protein
MGTRTVLYQGYVDDEITPRAVGSGLRFVLNCPAADNDPAAPRIKVDCRFTDVLLGSSVHEQILPFAHLALGGEPRTGPQDQTVQWLEVLYLSVITPAPRVPYLAANTLTSTFPYVVYTCPVTRQQQVWTSQGTWVGRADPDVGLTYDALIAAHERGT